MEREQYASAGWSRREWGRQRRSVELLCVTLASERCSGVLTRLPDLLVVLRVLDPLSVTSGLHRVTKHDVRIDVESKAAGAVGLACLDGSLFGSL